MMCPLCYAALVAQIFFIASLGVLLVSVTDFKFGLPLSVLLCSLALGNYLKLITFPYQILLLGFLVVILRSVLVLIFKKSTGLEELL